MQARGYPWLSASKAYRREHLDGASGGGTGGGLFVFNFSFFPYERPMRLTRPKSPSILPPSPSAGSTPRTRSDKAVPKRSHVGALSAWFSRCGR
jgi:hypothetical protein